MVCPGGSDCPLPEEFIIKVEGNNLAPPFVSGRAAGLQVSLGAGDYNVEEDQPPPILGLILLTAMSPDCGGIISKGEQFI